MNSILTQHHPSPEKINPNSLLDRITKGLIGFSELLKSDAVFNAVKRQHRLISLHISEQIDKLLTTAFSFTHDAISNRAFQFLTANNSQILSSIINSQSLNSIAEEVLQSQDRLYINRLASLCQITLTSFPSAIKDHFTFIPELANFADETSVFNMFLSFLSPDPFLSPISLFFQTFNFPKFLLNLADQKCDIYLGANLYILLFHCSQIDSLKQQLLNPSVLSTLSSTFLISHQPELCKNAESQLWNLLNALLSNNTQEFLVDAFKQAIYQIDELSSQLLQNCPIFSLPNHEHNLNLDYPTNYSDSDSEIEKTQSGSQLSSQRYNLSLKIDNGNQFFENNDQKIESDDQQSMKEMELLDKRVSLYYEVISEKEIPELGENICNAINFCANFLDLKEDNFKLLSQNQLEKLVENASLLFSAYPDHSFALNALSHLLFSVL